MTNRDQALQFVRSFCSGNVARLGDTLHDEFTLVGPLFQFDSKKDYLDCLASDPPERGVCELIDVIEDRSAIAVFYVYKKKTASVTVAQLFRFRDGLIAKTVLVFGGELADGAAD